MIKIDISQLKDKALKLGWKKITAIIIAAPIIGVVFLFLLIRFGVIGEVPTKAEMLEIRNPVSSSLLDARGELIVEYYIENRTNVELEEISPYFINGLIATEDVRFYEHRGIDLRSLARVIFKTILLRRESSGGGSTITQQLVKNIFKRKSYGILSSPIVKMREWIAARRLENIYTKDEILKLYVNTVSFGELAFGINTASNRFFNKAPKDLTLNEAATLVGILKAPSYYSPRKYPERAQARRDVVLAQMHKFGYLEESEKIETQELELSVEYMAPKGERLIAYAKQHVKKEFDKIKGDFLKPDGSTYNLYTDGLKIYTTLDKKMQRDAETIFAATMPNIQKQFFAGWSGSTPFKGSTKAVDDAIHKHPMYIRLKSQGLENKDILEQFTTKAKRRVWTWDGYQDKEISIIDSIKHYLTLVHGGMMAVSPQNGAIKVWVGGNDYGEFQFDNVSSARQVGSTFKPITYLLALENGKDPCEFYPNELRTYSEYKDWTPENAGGEYGGSYSMQGALAHSVNTVSVQLIMELGPENVVKKAHEMGVESYLPKVPSIVLGTADVTMVEMMKVYSTFANNGHTIDPYIISKIEDFDGNLLYEYKAKPWRKVMEEKNAKIMIQMLQNGTGYGSGSRINSYNLPVHIAGKTGTTQNQSDGWFIGASPNLVVGAWVGTDDRRIHFRSLTTGSGGRTALPLVGQLYQKAYAYKRIPAIGFDTTEFYLNCVDYSELSAEETNAILQEEIEEDEISLLSRLENIFSGNGNKENEVDSISAEEKEKVPRRRRRDKKLTLQERLDLIFKSNKKKDNGEGG